MFFLWISNYTSVDPKYELKGFNEGFHHACLWWVLGPRKSDFSIFWPWFQKSTKWVPGGPILAISHALGGGRYRNWAIYRRVATLTSTLTAKNAWFLWFWDRNGQFLTRWAGVDIEIEQFTAEWRHRHPLWPQKMHGFCGFGIAVANFWRAGRGTI